MRALVVSNMWPTPADPALGTFVRDQVEALRRREDVELDLLTFPPGGANYLRAVPRLLRTARHDVVHAHFGLTAAPALAARAGVRGVTLHGSDLIVPRSRRVSTIVARACDVVGVPSEAARGLLPRRLARRAAVLPCGVDLGGFERVPRREARAALGRDPQVPFALFPYDPSRAVKRADRARTAAGDVELVTLGRATRDEMRLWLCAASIVLCPAEWETFGTTAAEAAACGTAVLATPTGAHPELLEPLDWCHCGPFEANDWRRRVAAAAAADAQHDGGREHVARWSADAMADALVAAWRRAAGGSGQVQG